MTHCHTIQPFQVCLPPRAPDHCIVVERSDLLKGHNDSPTPNHWGFWKSGRPQNRVSIPIPDEIAAYSWPWQGNFRGPMDPRCGTFISDGYIRDSVPISPTGYR